MSFKWSEYLVLAETLFQSRAKFPDEEACFRAAISRAYYAAFCAARNRAREEGLPLNGDARDHDVVANCYAHSGIESREKIGLLLSRLRGKRNRADYSDTLGRPDSVCETSLTEARQVFKCLNKI